MPRWKPDKGEVLLPNPPADAARIAKLSISAFGSTPALAAAGLPGRPKISMLHKLESIASSATR